MTPNIKNRTEPPKVTVKEITDEQHVQQPKMRARGRFAEHDGMRR